MADVFRASFPASFFVGDQNAIIEAGDLSEQAGILPTVWFGNC